MRPVILLMLMAVAACVDDEAVRASRPSIPWNIAPCKHFDPAGPVLPAREGLACSTPLDHPGFCHDGLCVPVRACDGDDDCWHCARCIQHLCRPYSKEEERAAERWRCGELAHPTEYYWKD